jgi:hypothetical protein
MEDKLVVRIKRSPSDSYDYIMKYFDKRISEGKLSLSSKANYVNSIRILNSIIGHSPVTFDYKYFNSPEGYDKLSEYFKVLNKTKENIYKTLIMMFKILDVPIYDPYKELKYVLKDQVHEAHLESPKKVLPYDDYEEITKEFHNLKESPHIIEDLSSDRSTGIMKFLAMAIYSLVPPLRPSEWLDLKIYTSIPKTHIPSGNYLDLETGKVYYSDYKTNRTYGELEFELDKTLIKIIKKYYSYLSALHPSDPYKYLFTSNDGKSIMHQSNFTKLIKSIPLFKGLSPNDLRNLYVSSLGLKSAEERAKICRFMKHSMQTQSTIYQKYNKILYPENKND